jgi:hypothetical protein
MATPRVDLRGLIKPKLGLFGSAFVALR